jgi:hypothetical protein
MFKLQSANRQWRVFPVGMIRTSTMHFIYYCNGNECIDGHNLGNVYTKALLLQRCINMYFVYTLYIYECIDFAFYN